MNDDEFHPSRFMVRKDSKGWMVYDRQRKGPALVGTKLAVHLTKENAEHIQETLADLKAN